MQADQVQTPIPRVGADLPAACRQVGIVGWRPIIIGTDCRPVAIMELTSEDAALLLIASENVHLNLKRERSGFHEINQFQGQHGEYHHIFPQLKADGERFFQYFRMDIEMFTYIFKAYRRLWNALGIGGIWMRSSRVAFGGKYSSSDRYPHAYRVARQLILMIS